MRGKDTLVNCDSCGRMVPRNKAITEEKRINLGTEANEGNIRFFTTRKIWYCISCAKHKGIFEKKKQQAIRNAEREAARGY